MKPMSLKEMLIKLDENQVLKLKGNLNKYKKEGTLFFKGDIHEIDWEKPLEIYYFLSPGNIKYRNAFPVPSSHYWKIMNHVNPWLLLSSYYQTYYRSKKIPQKWAGNLYMYKEAKYVWFFRN
ncbi:hypothetical protein D0469_01720 [Peribacillus saganii]|uniref:Uncharacterized protein n=1 Tax=Peribacillus saganii TaxID=2303992 RepID=A0A372LTD1_9BACI|nr:hypothetical protein [Peribacillus saganii]RFU71449.1 hypothetical protein D0469_01720 [Peribacillus saganii]